MGGCIVVVQIPFKPRQLGASFYSTNEASKQRYAPKSDSVPLYVSPENI